MVAGPLTIVAFDDSTGHRFALQRTLAACGHRLHVREGARAAYSPGSVRAMLRSCGADVAIWDISPALPVHCQVLDSLLDEHVFDGSGLLVTTTDRRRVREYFGARCGEMTVLQQPCTTDQLCVAVSYAARHPRGWPLLEAYRRRG